MYLKSAGWCDVWEKTGVFGNTKDWAGLFLAIHAFLPWPGRVKSPHSSVPRIHFLMCKTLEVLWKPSGKRVSEDL